MSDQEQKNQDSNQGSSGQDKKPSTSANDMFNKVMTWSKQNPILAAIIVIVVLVILWAIV